MPCHLQSKSTKESHGRSRHIYVRNKKKYSPDFFALLKIAIRAAALHSDSKGLHMETWIFSERLTKIVSPMIIVAAEANGNRIGGWEYKEVRQVDQEQKQRQPNIIREEMLLKC